MSARDDVPFGKELKAAGFSPVSCALCHSTNGGHDLNCPALSADAQAGALKPCPFCGSPPHPPEDVGVYPFLSKQFVVECSNENCPAQPSVCSATEAEAVALWNVRC